MRYVVGIDAGGTHTVGLLADETGRVLARAEGGGANLQTDGELQVEKVFDAVLEELGSRRTVRALCLGIAGVDRPHDEAVVRGILRRLGHRESARVVNDALIALVAGAPGRTGIALVSGTGSIAFGVDPTGRTARSGGLGYLLSDEGSGYWLGQEALRAAVRAADGRGAGTALEPLLLEALGAARVSELVPLVYERGLPRRQIAGLAALVERAASGGDAVAEDILRRAAQELAAAARAVARQLDFAGGPYPLVLAGGAFRACPSLAGRVGAALELKDARPRLLEVEPARGAVTLALDLLREESTPP